MTPTNGPLTTASGTEQSSEVPTLHPTETATQSGFDSGVSLPYSEHQSVGFPPSAVSLEHDPDDSDGDPPLLPPVLNHHAFNEECLIVIDDNDFTTDQQITGSAGQLKRWRQWTDLVLGGLTSYQLFPNLCNHPTIYQLIDLLHRKLLYRLRADGYDIRCLRANCQWIVIRPLDNGVAEPRRQDLQPDPQLRYVDPTSPDYLQLLLNGLNAMLPRPAGHPCTCACVACEPSASNRVPALRPLRPSTRIYRRVKIVFNLLSVALDLRNFLAAVTTIFFDHVSVGALTVIGLEPRLRNPEPEMIKKSKVVRFEVASPGEAEVAMKVNTQTLYEAQPDGKVLERQVVPDWVRELVAASTRLKTTEEDQHVMVPMAHMSITEVYDSERDIRVCKLLNCAPTLEATTWRPKFFVRQAYEGGVYEDKYGHRFTITHSEHGFVMSCVVSGAPRKQWIRTWRKHGFWAMFTRCTYNCTHRSDRVIERKYFDVGASGLEYDTNIPVQKVSRALHGLLRSGVDPVSLSTAMAKVQATFLEDEKGEQYTSRDVVATLRSLTIHASYMKRLIEASKPKTVGCLKHSFPTYPP
jgi:hypothetical protein